MRNACFEILMIGVTWQMIFDSTELLHLHKPYLTYIRALGEVNMLRVFGGKGPIENSIKRKYIPVKTTDDFSVCTAGTLDDATVFVMHP